MQQHTRTAPHFQAGASHYWILAPGAPVPSGGQEIPDWDLGYREILHDVFGGHGYHAAPALQQLEKLGVATGVQQGAALADYVLGQRQLFRLARLMPVSGHGATGPAAPKAAPPPAPLPVGEFRHVSLAERYAALAGAGAVSAATHPSTPTRKLVIEVAGRDLERSQSLYLYAQGERPAEERQASSHDRDRHRSLVSFEGLPNQPCQVALAVAMKAGPSPMLLPLAKGLTTEPATTEKPEWENLLIPVKPLRRLASPDERVQADLLTDGWLYVFWQGRLWRELAVDDQGALRDVRVDWYRRQYGFGLADPAAVREVDGKALLAVWVPYRIKGAYQRGGQGVRLAFTRQPWSWTRIEALEAQADKLQRLTIGLDELGSYSQQRGFSQGAATGPATEALLDAPAPRKRVVEPHRRQEIAVAYVPDSERLSIKLLDAMGQSLAKVPYELTMGAARVRGQTDADGCIQAAQIAANQTLILTVWPRPEVESERQRWRLRPGELAPLTEARGRQQRVLYLSGYSAELDDPQQVEAIQARFLAVQGLREEGDLEPYLQNLESGLA